MIDGGQAVDAGDVVGGLVGLDAFVAFFAGPFVEDFARAFEVVEGDRVAARIADTLDRNVNDGACSGIFRKVWGERFVFGSAFNIAGAFSVEAEDLGRAFEGAEHDDDAAVFSEVGDGLGTAAGVVEVGGFERAEHSEAVSAFGREVDVSFGGERGGSDEEHFLFFYPGFVFGGDFGMDYHVRSWAARDVC